MARTVGRDFMYIGEFSFNTESCVRVGHLKDYVHGFLSVNFFFLPSQCPASIMLLITDLKTDPSCGVKACI